MQRFAGKQQGMTTIGWIIVLGLIAFFTLLVLRLAPIYMDYYKIKGALESLENEPLVTQKTPAQIRDLLDRRFDVNYVDSIKGKDVKVDMKDGRMRVSVDYEVRTHMLGNIDAVLTFNREVELIAH